MHSGRAGVGVLLHTLTSYFTSCDTRRSKSHKSLICLDPSELIARWCKELLIMRYAEYGIGRGQFRRTIRVDCISTSELYVLDDAAIVGPCKNTTHRSISVVELKASECEWNMLIIVDGKALILECIL
jgi:hypothetical protein